MQTFLLCVPDNWYRCFKIVTACVASKIFWLLAVLGLSKPVLIWYIVLLYLIIGADTL